MATGTHPSVERQVNALCQVCKMAKPVLSCKECGQSLCGPCKERHDKIPSFTKHAVVPLCEKHEQPLTHLCNACLVGMCLSCMLNDHIDHSKEFDTFADGVNNLRKKTSDLIENINKQEVKLKEDRKSTEDKLREGREMELGLKKLRATYADKISKIDNLLNDVEETYKCKGEKILKDIIDIESKCTNMKTSLDVGHKPDLDVLSMYASLDQESRDLLERMEARVSEKFEGLSLEEYDAAHMKCVEEADIPHMLSICKSKHVKVDITTKTFKMILDYTGEGQTKLRNIYNVEILSSDSVIVTDYGIKKALHVNKNGQLLRTYEPLDASKGPFYSTTIHGKHCFLTQSNAVTRVALDNPRDKQSVELGMNHIFQILHDENDDYIVSDLNSKAIYKYNMVSQRKVEMLRTEHKPWYITKTPRSTYIINLMSQGRQHEYSPDWKLLRVIGSPGSGDGQLNNAWGVTTTPAGHILVADFGTNRISCFNQDGTFHKNILTQKDGIRKPSDVALCYPLLWVTERDGHLKCFEVS